MGAPVIWFEIGCRDLKKTTAFYNSLLGWDAKPEGPAANVTPTGGQGIPGHIVSFGHEPHNFINVYAQVDDLKAHIEKAVELGGKHLVGPVEVPNMGHFAWIADPEGTPFGLWTPLKK